MPAFRLPVRQLVEFLLRTGSIDSRFTGFDRANEGARIHRKLQKAAGEGYQAEVFLSAEREACGIAFTLEGRADGIFTDENGKMNLSLEDIGGEMLVVSNFTLGTDCKKGRRPSFDMAAPPAEADRLYRHFVERARGLGIRKVETGEFGAHMDVLCANDGPVNIIIDTERIGK